jgi:hypothetical protein
LLECPAFAARVPDELIVLPGKAWAATAVSTPVKPTLPASSQRLVSVSLRNPASLVCDESRGIMESYSISEQNPS